MIAARAMPSTRPELLMRWALGLICSFGFLLPHTSAWAGNTAGATAPGNLGYPNGGMVSLGYVELMKSLEPSTPVWVDSANGYGYYGSNARPAQIVKFSLGSDETPAELVATLELDSSITEIQAGGIDPDNGYLWIGTYTTPGRILKIALGEGDDPPSIVGELTLNEGERLINTAALDLSRGYGYFTTFTVPMQVIKVRLGEGDSPPERLGAVTLDESDLWPGSIVLDTAENRGYIGNFNVLAQVGHRGGVIKINLGDGDAPPTRISRIQLEPDEAQLTLGMADGEDGHAYFATNHSVARGSLIKIAMTPGEMPPARVGSAVLEPYENRFTSGVVDKANGHAYLAAGTTSFIVKVDLGAGYQAPFRLGAFDAGNPGNPLRLALDNVGETLLSISSGELSRIARYVIDESETLPIMENRSVFTRNPESVMLSSFFDEMEGMAYFATSTPRSNVVAIGSPDVGDLIERVNGLRLGSEDSMARVMLFDRTNRYIYIATGTTPARVIKLALDGDGSAPRYVGSIELEEGEGPIHSGVIDEINGYAYLAVRRMERPLVMIDLGAGETLPSRVGSVEIGSDVALTMPGLLESDHGFVYFASGASPSKIVRLALDSTGELPSVDHTLILDEEDRAATAAAYDPESGYGYVVVNPLNGTRVEMSGHCNPFIPGSCYLVEVPYTKAARLVKIHMGDDENPPTRVAHLELDEGDVSISNIVIDGASGEAWMATSITPSRLIRVGLGEGNAPPVRIGALEMAVPSDTFASMVRNNSTGDLLVGTRENSGRVYQFATDPARYIVGSRIDLGDQARLESMTLQTTQAAGNLRLAIYAEAEGAKSLVWESGQVAKSQGEEWVTLPVEGPGGGALLLAPGTYWLVWQSDTIELAGGHTSGSHSSGFVVPLPFGDNMPEEISASAVVSNPTFWTQFITYTALGDTWVIHAPGM